jgi:hypothetical protein
VNEMGRQWFKYKGEEREREKEGGREKKIKK